IAEIRAKRFNDAIKDFSTVLELDPADAYAFFNRGRAKEKLGYEVEALEDYNRATQYALPGFKEAFEYKNKLERKIKRKK
ncbi:MAG: tetratricopeptide repeat protein, partial [Fusobacteriaceae bacterium]